MKAKGFSGWATVFYSFAVTVSLVGNGVQESPASPRPSYRIINLNKPKAEEVFWPVRINNRQEIAGTLFFPTQSAGEYIRHVAVYRQGKVHDLHSLIPESAGQNSEAIDLNDSGVMLVGSDFGAGRYLYRDGRMIALSNYAQQVLIPLSINNQGDIVGGGLAPDGTYQPFLLTAEGPLHFLGLLPGSKMGEALGSNRRRLVIGSMFNPDSQDGFERERAVILTTNE